MYEPLPTDVHKIAEDRVIILVKICFSFINKLKQKELTLLMRIKTSDTRFLS